MNCYGTNPAYTRSVQPVNTMTTSFPNNYPPQNFPLPAPVQQPVPPAQQTVTSGEWTQPVAVNPNTPTSPASIWQGVPANQIPDTLSLPFYTPGYLRQHIGDLMRVEFLIGSNTTDRVGRLTQVGASFIVLSSLDGGSEIVCDIFSIKFVTIIGNAVDAQLLTAFPSNG